MMKKIHFVSLFDCYGNLHGQPSYRLFINLVEKIPNTTNFYVGPFFPTMTDALEISHDSFQVFLQKQLADANKRNLSLYDPRLGNHVFLRAIGVTEQVVKEAAEQHWWNQIRPKIGNYEAFILDAKRAVSALFAKIKDGQECLVFMVFPFGEIICQEFLPAKEKNNTPIFHFSEGFSLSEDGSVEFL